MLAKFSSADKLGEGTEDKQVTELRWQAPWAPASTPSHTQNTEFPILMGMLFRDYLFMVENVLGQNPAVTCFQ